MFDRKHIERILKINGVSLPAPDEEIRSVLLGARYRDEEVDMALMVLKETITQSDQSADSLQKLIRTDQSLSAKEISKLLGIEVTLTPKSEMRKSPSSPQLTLGHHIVIWLLAAIIGVFGILLAMYVLEFGIFHPSSAILFYEAW